MDFLKKFWPLSFREKKEVKDLVIMVIIYFFAPTIVSIVLGLLGRIPVIGIIFNIINYVCGGLFGLYCTAGIVFTFLNYFKVGPFKTEA